MGILTVKGKEMEDYPIKVNEKECPERWEENRGRGGRARASPGPRKRKCQGRKCHQ